MFMAGVLAMLWLLPAPRTVFGVTFDIHTLVYAAVAVVVGFQSVLFWVFAKIYGMREGIVPWDPGFQSILRLVSLENGLVVGGLLVFLGISLAVYALGSWDAGGFGALRPTDTMRLVIPSATAILLGMHMAYGAFFVSVLEIQATRSKTATEKNNSAKAIA
jgi:hypothetical protein